MSALARELTFHGSWSASRSDVLSVGPVLMSMFNWFFASALDSITRHFKVVTRPELQVLSFKSPRTSVREIPGN